MEMALLLDIGSTYTKAVVIDLENTRLVTGMKALTTANEDIMIGIEQIFKGLDKQGIKVENIKHRLACSSAAGGLKLITSGLVPELTAEAAKRAALGAGAKVEKVFSYEMSKNDIDDIKKSCADVILLAGGTDGGKKDTIIKNAERIAKTNLDIPIIVAGNKLAAEEIEEIFKDSNKEYYITENVMPQLGKLNVDPARKQIREVFLSKIINAKGFNSIEKYFGKIIMPTPSAVMTAAELISKGTRDKEGLGELMVVDIGGATTDVYSVTNGLPSKAGVSLKGLEEPYVKRTVEGDLGMRYSSLPTLQGSENNDIFRYSNGKNIIDELFNYAKKVTNEVNYLPVGKEKDLEIIIAKAAVDKAIRRHSGKIKVEYTPMGESYIQFGKDLTNVKNVIATGGILVNNQNTEDIVKTSFYTREKPEILTPVNAEIIVDKKYLLSSIGLLSKIDEEAAFDLAEKYLDIRGEGNGFKEQKMGYSKIS